MTDPLDQPEPEGYGLVFPFVVCASQGGPYDDVPFVAGYQAGRIDMALKTAAAAGADRVTLMVDTPLVPQLELIAMHHGFPVVETAQVEETEDHPAMPEWTHIRFSTSEEAAR